MIYETVSLVIFYNYKPYLPLSLLTSLFCFTVTYMWDIRYNVFYTVFKNWENDYNYSLESAKGRVKTTPGQIWTKVPLLTKPGIPRFF